MTGAAVPGAPYGAPYDPLAGGPSAAYPAISSGNPGPPTPAPYPYSPGPPATLAPGLVGGPQPAGTVGQGQGEMKIAVLEGSAAQAGDTFDPTGKYKVKFQGAFTALEVAITANDGAKSESGSMITVSHNVDLVAKIEGGVGAGLLRSCCTGNSFFFSNYFLKPGMGARGDVLLAPAVPGEIILLHLDGRVAWTIHKGGYLCSDSSVQLTTIAQNVSQGCCSGQGFFLLQAQGIGRLLLCSYGSIARYDLQPGEVRRIEQGFLVAWTSHTQYTIGLAASGIANSLFSSQGLVTVFTGPGTVYVQSRSIKALADVLRPFLPTGGGGADNSAGIGSGF